MSNIINLFENSTDATSGHAGHASAHGQDRLVIARGAIRLLLIEDDELDAATVYRGLHKSPVAFEIDHARTLAEAIARLQYNDYSVVLVDINLPDARGVESFDQLRAFDSRLPIVVLTGYDDDDLGVYLICNGAQDYLCKSQLDEARLRRTLRFAIVRHELALGFQAAAQRDPLTGLPNRRKLGEEFEQSMRLANQYHEPFSVALIDLDHFKYVNDQFGHCFGDVILKEVSQRLIDKIGCSCWLGRFGGEEFAVLMPRTSLTQATGYVQDLIDHVAEHPFQVDDVRVPLTASAGVALVSLDDQWETVFNKCDQALYRAKLSGRNRLEVQGPESPLPTSVDFRPAADATCR